MSVIAILLVIIILVFVHEMGHFLFAKWTGCRVDEFSVGFKPALLEKKWGETNYVLGLIPIGGYVKIWGENGSEETDNDPDNPMAFYNRPRLAQALVLLGGVLFNMLLAWVLFSVLIMMGTTVNQDQFPDYDLQDSQVVVAGVLSDYPASLSGIRRGSVITAVEAENSVAAGLDAHAITQYIADHHDKALTITFDYGDQIGIQVVLNTQEYQGRNIVGFELETMGTLQLSLVPGLIAGAQMTWGYIQVITMAFVHLIGGLFDGSADASALAGPVGIAGMAGDSLQAGFDSFIWFLAILSLNLAVFNLLPIPALDGGRLVFVAIESIMRRPIPAQWFTYIHVSGFMFLIAIMIVVTFLDISKLFS